MNNVEVQSQDNLKEEDSEKLFLVFNLCSQWFGIEALKVREIIKVPVITKLPNQPESIRGLIRLRDKVIPVIDSRYQLSMETMQDEKNSLINMLKEREQDHINYINELINCIESNQEFKLTTDEKACKFGQWYYNFKTDNLILSDFLEKFDIPHCEVHGIARKIIRFQKDGDHQKALEYLQIAKDEKLNLLLELFKELYLKIESMNREFAILYDKGSEVTAFTVDKVHQIMRIKNSDIKPLPSYSTSKFTEGVFQTDVGMCIILNEKFLSDGIGDLTALITEN